jgi:hypothetical protein
MRAVYSSETFYHTPRLHKFKSVVDKELAVKKGM